MPIYEYKCRSCSRLTSAFVRNPEKAVAPACQHCGGKTATALSRFSNGKGEAKVLEQFGSAPRGATDHSDPRQIGRWVEDKFDQYGMDHPDQAREMIDAARDGDLPDAVKDL
jgi:putative FmdB family regulatory protein